jgi:hypothetical protein
MVQGDHELAVVEEDVGTGREVEPLGECSWLRRCQPIDHAKRAAGDEPDLPLVLRGGCSKIHPAVHDPLAASLLQAGQATAVRSPVARVR